MKGHGGSPFVILNTLGRDSFEFASSGPQGQQSEEKHFPSQTLGCSKLVGLEGGSGEGHEDQGKVPLRKNPVHPRALPGEGGEQGSGGRIMAHIPSTCHCAWVQLFILEEVSEEFSYQGNRISKKDLVDGLGGQGLGSLILSSVSLENPASLSDLLTVFR